MLPNIQPRRKERKERRHSCRHEPEGRTCGIDAPGFSNASRSGRQECRRSLSIANSSGTRATHARNQISKSGNARISKTAAKTASNAFCQFGKKFPIFPNFTTDRLPEREERN